MTELSSRKQTELRTAYRRTFAALKDPEQRARMQPELIAFEEQRLAQWRAVLGETEDDILNYAAAEKARKAASADKNPLSLELAELQRRRNAHGRSVRFLNTVRTEAAKTPEDSLERARYAAKITTAEGKVRLAVQRLGYDPEDKGGNRKRYVTKVEAFAKAEEREADAVRASIPDRTWRRWMQPSNEIQARRDKERAEREYLRRHGFRPSIYYANGEWGNAFFSVDSPEELEIDTDEPIGEYADGSPRYASIVPITAAERRAYRWGREATPEQIRRRIRSRKGLSRMERTRQWWRLRYQRWLKQELALLRAGRLTPELTKLIEAHRPPPEIDEGLLLKIAEHRGWLFRTVPADRPCVDHVEDMDDDGGELL